MIKVLRCDNCGKINPPHFDDNPCLCGACACPGGFYTSAIVPDVPGPIMGTNGKVCRYRLQFPFRLVWRGWWTL